MPPVPVKIDYVPLGGGLDLVSSSLQVAKGSAAQMYNYENLLDGGYERIRGIERFDGQPSPSQAVVESMAPATSFTGVAVGNTINGLTSGATAVVALIEPAYLIITKRVGAFTLGETIRVGVTSIGVYNGTAETPNEREGEFIAACAEVFRPLIAAPPGDGSIRGVAVLNNTVYAWRNNGAAMRICKATAAGWVVVDLGREISFTAGTVEYLEGATLTKGAVSATVRRVVLETGTFLGGTAAGRIIIGATTGGEFTAGLTSGSQVNLSGPSTAITLLANGVVETDTYNFTASTDTIRLYGCDGMNREFEFDGTVYVPLSTGMTAVRASFVKCHKNHLFFTYRGSLQHSAVGFPYRWSPLFGAAELGLGDVGTGLLTVGGSESSAAMMVFCQNSVWTLYGDSAATWSLKRLSEQAGANAYSVQDAGGPIAHDAPGFVRYQPTQSFGNFQWELASRKIEPSASSRIPLCSVFVKSLSRYRVFFVDGGAVSGTPIGKEFAWSLLGLGKAIRRAVSAEMIGGTRTFYGADDGLVYEADAGLSLDGQALPWLLKTSPTFQGNQLVLKQYRSFEVEFAADSFVTMSGRADFSDEDQYTTAAESEIAGSFSSSGKYDLSNYDSLIWDGSSSSKQRLRTGGQGYNVSLSFAGQSTSQPAHSVRSISVLYTQRRITR